jgi:UrcA family protein
MLRSISSVVLAATLCSTAFITAPASAEDRSFTVKVAGLDLAKPAGVAELQHRVNRAVNNVCGDAETGNFAEIADRDHCRKMAAAAAQVRIAAVVSKAQQQAKVDASDLRIAAR